MRTGHAPPSPARFLHIGVVVTVVALRPSTFHARDAHHDEVVMMKRLLTSTRAMRFAKVERQHRPATTSPRAIAIHSKSMSPQLPTAQLARPTLCRALSTFRGDRCTRMDSPTNATHAENHVPLGSGFDESADPVPRRSDRLPTAKPLRAGWVPATLSLDQ